MEMHHFGSGICSQMRLSAGAIFRATVPETIIRSDWRGLGRKTSAPKRAMSNRDVLEAIISMGACSSVGGPFNTYAVLQGVDKIVPVDVYILGCPPRPENLFYGLLKLQEKIDGMSMAKRPTAVRLEEQMLEDFKKSIRIGKVGTPELVQIG